MGRQYKDKAAVIEAAKAYGNMPMHQSAIQAVLDEVKKLLDQRPVGGVNKTIRIPIVQGEANLIIGVAVEVEIVAPQYPGAVAGSN